MAKPILLIIALTIALSSVAQNKTLHQFEIKGGFLNDQDDQRASFLEKDFGDEYRLNYQGLKYIAIGYTQRDDKTILGIEIDYFKYGKLTPDYSRISGPIVPPDRYKQQIQFAIFYGRSIINTKKVDLYIAPITSISFRTNTLFGPYVDLDASIQDLVIGLGGKLQANFSITNKFSLSLGSKLIVLDYYERNEVNSIIRTKHFDFIRGDVVLQAGFVFNI